jgi:hypothetical protein
VDGRLVCLDAETLANFFGELLGERSLRLPLWRGREQLDGTALASSPVFFDGRGMARNLSANCACLV